jgi:hypothetical protein
VAQAAAIPGNASFDLGHRTARYVLVWITDLGNGPPLVRAEIDELTLQG